MLLVGAWYYFDKKDNAENNLETNNQEQLIAVEKHNKEEITFPEGTDPVVKETVAQLSKHILLPTGDIKVATVTDAEEFKKQDPMRLQFVQNNHKLIQTAHGIIIFNQELDKIVDIVRVYPEIKTDQEKTQ
ncbi:MAG: hypothetical protein CL685_03835 [Candidatus Magasanikbacteria bacterium]|nr:hypothetical protein [Candidatus Magasanikbacteria bacterium]